MNVLFKSDETNKLNDIVRNEISQNLFIFCNYEPTPPEITNDFGGLFLLEISNFYKLLIDSGWIIKKFIYIYSGQEQCNISSLPFTKQDINNIFLTLRDLRTGFCHNVSHNNGDDIIINKIKEWFSQHKLNATNIDYPDCVKQIDDDAKKVIIVCNQFINCIKEMSDSDKKAAIERWKSVIIEHYKKKRDIFINIVGSYYLAKNAQSYPKNIYDFKQKIVNEIILSYFTYDFEQYLYKINNLSVKEPKKLNPIIKLIYDTWNKRACDLFNTADYNLLYPKTNQDKEKLIDLFFEKALENVIKDTLINAPNCSLLPQYIFNEVFDKTVTKFEGFKFSFKRFDINLR